MRHPLMKRLTVAWAVAAAVTVHVAAQAPASRTRTYVETLASERFEGRLAGSKGEQLASGYIASELQRIGARPLPGQSGYLLPFDFTAGTKDGGSTISIGGPNTRRLDGDVVRALSFSDNGDVSGSVVFAGYGLVVP